MNPEDIPWKTDPHTLDEGLSKEIARLVWSNPLYHQSNTIICIKWWEQQLGYELPEDIRNVIMKFKPETLTKIRRDLIESTKEQKVMQRVYEDQYTTKGVNYDKIQD